MFQAIVPVALFFIVAYIIKIISDNRVRRLLIEKGQVEENVKDVLQAPPSHRQNSLKWGLVILTIGVALMATSGLDDDMRFGAILIAAGISLVIYYFLANRLS